MFLSVSFPNILFNGVQLILLLFLHMATPELFKFAIGYSYIDNTLSGASTNPIKWSSWFRLPSERTLKFISAFHFALLISVWVRLTDIAKSPYVELLVKLDLSTAFLFKLKRDLKWSERLVIWLMPWESGTLMSLETRFIFMLLNAAIFFG